MFAPVYSRPDFDAGDDFDAQGRTRDLGDANNPESAWVLMHAITLDQSAAKRSREEMMWYHPAAFRLTKRDVTGAWLVCVAVAMAFFGYPVVTTAFDDCTAGVLAGIAGHDPAS